MINVLISEDSAEKSSEIIKFMSSLSHYVQISLEVARSVASTKSLLKSKSYDVLILDIQLPSYDGGNPEKEAGRELLSEIYRRKGIYNLPEHVIGLTSYRESIAENEIFFKKHLKVILDFGDLSWKSILEDQLYYTQAKKNGQLLSLQQGQKCDVAILTALKEPELRMVRELPLSWTPLKIDGDPVNYFIGEKEIRGNSIRFVCAHASEMGMSAASSLTTKVIAAFSPDLIVMTGICGAIEGKANLGDILVADPVFDYNLGKMIEGEDGKPEFEADQRQLRVNEDILTNFSTLDEDKIFLEGVWKNFEGEKPKSFPSIRAVPVGCGASVIANAEYATALTKRGARKVTGIEMETYGVYYSAQKTYSPPIPVFALKSVCDYANKIKEDRYQGYCSYVSANVCLEYICRFYERKS